MHRLALYSTLKGILRGTVGGSLKESIRYVSTKNHYDIIVVGGGLIGSTLACTLGKNSRLSDKSILLLESCKKREFSLPEKYSNRVSALNMTTQKLLDSIGVWKHIESARFGTIKEMQVWEANSEAMINFRNDEPNKNGIIAYIVENDLTLGSVYKELEKLSNVEIINEACIGSFKLVGEDRDTNQLTLKDGSHYTCDLLLGCEGYNSQVRQKMDVHYVSFNYNQMGIVATLELEEGHDGLTAWQRWLPTGPIALLPLSNKLSSLVWSASSSYAKELMSLTDQDFVDAINRALCEPPKKNAVVDESTKAFDKLLGLLNLSSNKVRTLPPKIVGCQEKSRTYFPLGFGHATNYVSKGVALAGDAAHRVHPLAGQGVNLGFGDIVTLNKILGEAAYAGSELGSLLYLKDYETQRQQQNIPKMLVIDCFHRMHTTEFPPIVLMRSIGVQAVHALEPLKSLIRNQAS